MTFFFVGIIPAFQAFAADGMAYLIHILHVFGNGNVLQGSLVIGIASGVVSTLFDVCNLLILSKPIR